jgi:hypothetical protein
MQYYCITLRKEWDRKGGCPSLHMILPLRGVAEETMELSQDCLSPEADLKSEPPADVEGVVW